MFPDMYTFPHTSALTHLHGFLNFNTPGLRKALVTKMSRYDMLVGMVKLESYFSFTADDVQYGIEADRKARVMRTFVKNTYRLVKLFKYICLYLPPVGPW